MILPIQKNHFPMMMLNKTKIFLIISLVYLLGTGCKEVPKEWVFKEEIRLNGIKPLGIIVEGEEMWLTDVDNNRMVKTDLGGNVLRSYPGLMRPMHFAMTGSKVYVTEFLGDTISILRDENRSPMRLDVELDGPAGIDVDDKTTAIIDFYNHRLILNNNGEITIIGKKGHADGEFNYPTDVELFDDQIFVADAYNNRVQVFDYAGKVLKVIGWREDIRVATGLAIGPDRVYVTDFHGSRILIYDFEGVLLKVFEDHLDKPTDIYVNEDLMYVANYGGGSVTVFNLQ